MQRTFKFRLYPNSDQQYKLQNNLAVCRWLYNRFVEQAKKSFISRNDMNYILTELKQSEPWLYNYHSKMLQMVSTQLEGAEKSLIELDKNGHKTGQLRFARYSEYRTFTYNQSGFEIKDGFLHLSKIGRIKIICHRDIPDNVDTKQVAITKSKSGKWFACMTVDITEPLINIPKISFSRTVGIDVGIKSFAYDSDDHSTPNPLNPKKISKPLARVQRKVSRRKKGSNNRLKAILHLQRVHERIVNRRKDFQHKLSTQYAKNHDVIFVEDLKIPNMVKNRKLARSIMDSSWGTFLQKLEYKCKMLVKVPAKSTTVNCFRCGSAVPKTLAVRIHKCGKCGLRIDRDYNASINILQKGLGIFNIRLPQELRELTPVKISERSMKQEATSFIKR